MKKSRVFSGMRPTGPLHLGHLAGALTNWVAMQEENECFFGIVDWHALTSEYADAGKIRQNSLAVLLDWLSVGIDPEKSCIFLQSHVPQHAELALALGMITPLGWLERCPTYKEQIQNIQNKDLSNFGFLGYPVLMASDILVYKADKVPVGEDQSAHMELAREIARRFNHFFGAAILPEPQTVLTATPKVPGTDGRKMSKSYGNSLYISETPQSMWDKLRTMVTDPAREKRTDPGEPGKCPVWDIHEVFNGDDAQKAELAEGCRTAGIGCIDCKKALNAQITAVMEPIRERRARYEKDEAALSGILDAGARRAEAVARSTMAEIYPAMGLIPRADRVG
jgi:tryptophanyl-tRNA synthetase